MKPEKSNYTEELQHLTQAAEQGKSQNPKSYGAGAIAGTLAPMAIPVVGHALEAAPIMGNAALGAAQSLSDTNIKNLTKSDIANAGVGAGIGAVAGGIGKALGALAPSAEEAGASSSAKGFGMRARSGLRGMGDDPQAKWLDLGNWANQAETPGGEKLVGLAKRPGEMLKAINEIKDDAGQTIGSVIKKINPNATIDKDELISQLQPMAKRFRISSPETVGSVNSLIEDIEGLAKSGDLNFKALHELKSAVGEGLESNPRLGLPYGVLSDTINNMVDQYGQQIADPAVKAAYDAAKLDYRNASLLLPTMRRAEGYELAQGPAGNSGLLGMFGLASGVAAGHPAAGAASMLGSAIGRPVANMVGRNAALKAVPYMPGIAAVGRGLNKAAQLELANALESQFGQGK
jgi:hypothetical protein